MEKVPDGSLQPTSSFQLLGVQIYILPLLGQLGGILMFILVP